MADTTIKMCFTHNTGKPSYSTIVLNYKPVVNLKNLTFLEKLAMISALNETVNIIQQSLDVITDNSAVDVRLVCNNGLAVKDQELVNDNDSSTGKEVKSNYDLYVYYNKVKLGYGSGVAICIAETIFEAHDILMDNTEDYKWSQYDPKDWIVVSKSTKRKPEFIIEHSYQE